MSQQGKDRKRNKVREAQWEFCLSVAPFWGDSTESLTWQAPFCSLTSFFCGRRGLKWQDWCQIMIRFCRKYPVTLSTFRGVANARSETICFYFYLFFKFQNRQHGESTWKPKFSFKSCIKWQISGFLSLHLRVASRRDDDIWLPEMALLP